jgi:hypothetical protein
MSKFLSIFFEFSRKRFVVFLNSPYRETPKNVLKKKIKKIFWGWLVPWKLIKYTSGSPVIRHLFWECPLFLFSSWQLF